MLASQGVYVLLVWRRLRQALVAFAVVGIVGTPFWLADLRLANRFDVGVAGADSGKLGAPLPVLRYLKEVAGDFSSGWTILLVPILVLAAFGARELWRRNRQAAYLAACVVAVPSAAMLAARLGSGASPETRHLIFVLPFFVLALALGVLALGEVRARGRVLRGRLARRRAARLGLREDAAALHRRPFVAGRGPDAAARWLASTTRDDDVFFGYEPVYLEAWEQNSGVARIVIPRADSKLAAARLDACASRSAAACGSSTRTTRTTARARGRSRSRSGRRVRPRLRGARVRPVPRDPSRASRRGRPRSTSTTPRR